MNPYDHSSTAHISKDMEAVKSPLTDEWIKKWCIYTMEYYLAIKKEWTNTICSNMDVLSHSVMPDS